MNGHLRLCTLLLVICALLTAPSASGEEAPFPRPEASNDGLIEPESLRSAVSFWMQVYLEATTDAGLLHDSRHLGVVYETVRFGDVKGTRARQKQVDRRRRYWRNALRRMADGAEPRDNWEKTALTLLEVELGQPPTARDLRNAARRVRFQLGQRDKFRAGIIRSGRYEDAMRETFRRAGLPEDLAYLPHVESSFNVKAYSKYGAAGVWQFMRRTGRQFLSIDYVVDERLDPMLATHAAARLLKRNHDALDSWPLAVTAYNHGRAGMVRAKRRMKTDDLGVIVRKYSSRTFGFASRNFYAQFLAARRILRAYEPYFGPLVRDAPETVDEIELPFYVDIDDLRQFAGVAPDVVRHYNPALRPPVFRSGKRIPKGYNLRLPAGTVTPEPETWLAAIPGEKRHAKQYRSNFYQVRRGDSLSVIARRSHTTVSTLVAINNLPSRHRIYPGQVLQLPDDKRKKAKPRKSNFEIVRSAQAATKTPAPEVVPPKPVQPLEVPPVIPLPIEKTEVAQAELPLSEPPLPKPHSSEPTKGELLEQEPLAGTLIAAVPKASKVQTLTEPFPSVAEDSPWRRVDGDSVIVDALETLGHFADWLELPTQRLRDLNRLSGKRPLTMGGRLRLDFSRVKPEQFLSKRMEFHKGIEEDFFGSFRVAGTVEHTLRRGESLWELSHNLYSVPSWLIRRYNPELDLRNLSPGAKLVIPVVARNNS